MLATPGPIFEPTSKEKQPRKISNPQVKSGHFSTGLRVCLGSMYIQSMSNKTCTFEVITRALFGICGYLGVWASFFAMNE